MPEEVAQTNSGRMLGLFSSRKDSKDPKAKEDEGLWTIMTISAIGLAALVIVSWWAGAIKDDGAFGAVFGLSVIVGLAAMISGGVLGFLFGIPRSLQKNTPDTIPVTNGGTPKERSYSNNTNLEQISDWLTKIIVGVSLTQLPEIERRFHNLSLGVAKGFEGYIDIKFSYPYSKAIILFYAVCGFLAVYLWAKIYLLQQLVMLDRNLDARINQQLDKKVEAEVSKQSNKLEITRLESLLSAFTLQKNLITAIETNSDFKRVIDAAQPGPIKFIDDCQKGRWGGVNSAGGYTFVASFSSKKPDNTYDITLTVKPEKENVQLIGDVYFFLHESYYPACIVRSQAINNTASIVVGSSYEAFTVGAFCYNSNVKLELDLNIYSGTPADYNYFEPLQSFDDVKKKLDELKQES